MTKIDIFRKLYENHKESKNWLDLIPSDISLAFFDNTYVSILQDQSNMLLKHIFTESELADIEWFLYEWSNDSELYVYVGRYKHRFSSVEYYIDFLIKHRGWKE